MKKLGLGLKNVVSRARKGEGETRPSGESYEPQPDPNFPPTLSGRCAIDRINKPRNVGAEMRANFETRSPRVRNFSSRELLSKSFPLRRNIPLVKEFLAGFESTLEMLLRCVID